MRPTGSETEVGRGLKNLRRAEETRDVGDSG